MIAVGIETAAQQFLLAELGCASLQGFHLGMQCSPADLIARFSRHSPVEPDHLALERNRSSLAVRNDTRAEMVRSLRNSETSVDASIRSNVAASTRTMRLRGWFWELSRSAKLHEPAEFRFQGVEIPTGEARAAILNELATLSIDGVPPSPELEGYLNADLDRFLYTLALVPGDIQGTALEIGANPYFMSALLNARRPDLKFEYVNYFHPLGSARGVQHVRWSDRKGEAHDLDVDYMNINLEEVPLPVEDERYDLILFCEVLEHFIMHPYQAVTELWRKLKPGGTMVLTTPNSARYETVVALLEGHNVYDQYSGYGPHGRHNREYVRHELHMLMKHCGFTCELDFTSDVRPNWIPQTIAHRHAMWALKLTRNREHDLGQYLFSRWRKTHDPAPSYPQWLYRSYPDGMIA